MHISTLLLGDMSLWAVHCLHVFPEGAGVCVALGAAWDLAHIWFLIRVCSVLVLGAIRSIRKSFVAALMLTDVWFLSSVGSQVRFQVF